MTAVHTRDAIKAAKARWKMVAAVQDEFARQFIHENLTVSEVIKLTRMSDTTVRRFFHRGDHVGKKNKSIKPYSIFHGPYAATVFGIAKALGFEIKVVNMNPRNGSGK